MHHRPSSPLSMVCMGKKAVSNEILEMNKCIISKVIALLRNAKVRVGNYSQVMGDICRNCVSETIIGI